MQYFFSISEPHHRFLTIEMSVQGPFMNDNFELQLPSWRPGRYELGNFAKNVRGFCVKDKAGNSIPFQKKTKDCWEIKNNKKDVTIQYQYYAAQPDAGACWLDHDQMYVNPIHCCMYIPGRENEKCEVQLTIPQNWKVATGLNKKDEHIFEADNFDQLVDSPFIASPTLQHADYVLNGIKFHIWIQGDCNPDWLKIIRDFDCFTQVQLDMMKEFPVKEYHFLVQILPYTFYHGVEHLNSTVLALGPGYNLMKPALYADFLGVASHELFHVWNVKSIRPIEMHPYNLTGENYASTGFIYEGVTTYYGDLFLGRSGFFNLKALLEELSVRLQKHMDNPGRFNYSVAESSFDTWLDGYVPGIPGRKTSIYDEGCLLAWILDFMIRSATDSKFSLDQVMQALYFDFAKKGKGYSFSDYQDIAERIAGRSFKDYFENVVSKPSSLESLLSEVVSLAGLELKNDPSPLYQERMLGIRTEMRGASYYINSIYPQSPASIGGLMKDDEIIAVDGIKVENNLSELVSNSSNKHIVLTIFTNKKLKTIQLLKSDQRFYDKYSIVALEEITAPQLNFRNQWLKK